MDTASGSLRGRRWYARADAPAARPTSSADDGRTDPALAGTQLQRITYHYWCHIGEASAVRQMLGHRRLAQFVGDIDGHAPFRREPH